MKTALLAALLALAGFAARAQTHYLDLTAQTLGEANGVVALTQVLDGRAGNPPIGLVYPRLSNKPFEVAFRQGLETELTAFVRTQVPLQTTVHRAVLCVRSLHVAETAGANGQVTGQVAADAYEEVPGGYRFVQRVEAQVGPQVEVTDRYTGHVAQLLRQCLGQLVMADWAAARGRPAQALSALRTVAPAPGRREAATILREAPRRGLYHRYEQFLTNRPDTTAGFRIDTIRRRFKSELAAVKWQGVARLQPERTTGSGPPLVAANLWGFCDGQQAYVCYHKQFYPLVRQSTFFTFVGEAPVDPIHAAALVRAQTQNGVMFGLIGAAMTQTRVPDHSAEPMAYGLDLRTGALGPYPSLHTPARTDTAYLYLYRPRQATAASLVSVYVEGRIVGVLRPGQYLEVPWSRFGKPMRLCLGGLSGGGSCQYLVPDMAALNYLRINPKSAKHPWQWVLPAEGAAALDELDKQAK